jgi:hypothetical protein
VIDFTGARVDGHGNRADDLAEEDNQDGLPPVQAASDHDGTESPVVHRQTEVEEEVIPPFPGPGLWWCWKQVCTLSAQSTDNPQEYRGLTIIDPRVRSGRVCVGSGRAKVSLKVFLALNAGLEVGFLDPESGDKVLGVEGIDTCDSRLFRCLHVGQSCICEPER